MQGREAPFMAEERQKRQLDFAREQMAQQQRQFEQSLAEQTRVHDVSIQETQMGTAVKAASILDLIGKHGTTFSPEERKQIGDIIGPALLAGLQGDPKAKAISPELSSKLVDAFLQGRTGNLQALYTDLDPDQLRFLGQLEPAQIGAQADKFRTENIGKVKAAMVQDLPSIRRAVEQADPSRKGQPIPASVLLEHPSIKQFLSRNAKTSGIMNAALVELLKDEKLLAQHQIVPDVEAADIARRTKTAQMQEAETTAAIGGKAIPVTPEGTVAIVGPPKVKGGAPTISTTEVPGRKPPGEPTRFLQAEMRSALAGLDDLSARAEIGSPALFGIKSATEAFFSRAKEQVGVGMSKPEYEAFWADMRFARAKAIRALEKGNISQGDIQFFLAGFPEASDPPSVGLIKTQATATFVKERLSALEAEFTRTPHADPKEIGARVSTQLISRRSAAIRDLQASMTSGEIKKESQALEFLKRKGLSHSEAILVILTIPKKK